MDQNILREYLVALGFKVDYSAKKKFGDSVTSLDKTTAHLGKTVAWVATGLTAMAGVFAAQMEKLYYASKLANTSASQLQGIDFGAKMVGISNMKETLVAFASALRANPGMVKLLEDIVGVDVKGMSTADQLKALTRELNKMPVYLANQYGAKFGMSPDMVFLLREGGLEKLEEAEKRYAAMAAGMGLNLDEANKAGLQYAQTWRDILAQVDLFQKLLVVHILPEMQELASYASKILGDWAAILNMPRGKFIADMKEAIGASDPRGGGVKLSADAEARLAAQEGATANERALDRGLAPEKTYQEMSDDERVQSGKGRKSMFGFGKVVPSWENLTPAERTVEGLPATDADKPWDWKLQDKVNRLFEKPAEMAGLKSVHPEGGVELSSRSKERLGQSRLESSAPTPAQQWLYGAAAAIGYKSKPKDAPDTGRLVTLDSVRRMVAEQREAKLQDNPDLRRQLDEALRRGDYAVATSITSSLDEMPDVALGERPAPAARDGEGTQKAGMTREEYLRAVEAAGKPGAAPAAPAGPALANQPQGERGAAADTGTMPQKQQFLVSLEQKYALPSGFLDRVWKQESGRGRAMLSPKGAKGHFGFMDATGEEFGLRKGSGDANDFKKSADASARYMAQLVQKYADVRLAAAAYNWGPTNLDKLLAQTSERHPDWTQQSIDNYALGHAPKETRDYVNATAGASQPTLNAETTINVYGAGDAKATAAEVQGAQKTVNADLVRQFKQRVQ